NEAGCQFNLEPTMIGKWIKACEEWDESVKNEIEKSFSRSRKKTL
ncbi:12257_t:CDS:1, partial [Entrophospora sp. SA101]